ncbi:MAG TPA: cupin domain-containing protein [Longimicrobium sp.]|jgi:quercetin dioxygenase-like cupin family protein|uniref:cupin domain-containing protein n=1 Tax=Longimicrobium sp. TaxID=2029185 RepID=UPI002ED9E0FE
MSNGLQAALMPLVVMAGQGTQLPTPGTDFELMLDGEQTGGALAIALTATHPGGGPPPHVHQNEDEIFIVQEGTIELWSDGAWTPAGPGSVSFLPRGVPHTYRNAGTEIARHWVIVTPAGFDRFYARWSEEFNQPAGPDMASLMQIAAEHGIEILGPPPAE